MLQYIWEDHRDKHKIPQSFIIQGYDYKRFYMDSNNELLPSGCNEEIMPDPNRLRFGRCKLIFLSCEVYFDNADPITYASIAWA